MLLTVLREGQQATVLQLPAEPKNYRPTAGGLRWLTVRNKNDRQASALIVFPIGLTLVPLAALRTVSAALRWIGK